MEFPEIPRPSLGDEVINRRNPLFNAGNDEAHIPTFTGFGNNITGNFLRPGLKMDGGLNMPRYHPKYTMSGIQDDLDDQESIRGSTIKKIPKMMNSFSMPSQDDDLTGEKFLIDPPEEEFINVQKFDEVSIQEKVVMDSHDRGNVSYYSCCYSPSVLLCRTLPGYFHPVTPWMKRIFCVGFVIVVNIFLLLLLLAIGLETGIDGFSGRNANSNVTSKWNANSNVTSKWNDLVNDVRNVTCPLNDVSCLLGRSGATGNTWVSSSRDFGLVLRLVGTIAVALCNAFRT